jgi:shikimate dehydrogenase
MSRILVGLIGANILKSLSPALHQDAFAAAGLDGYYHLMDVEQLRGRTLPALLGAAKTTGFVGLNVTFPFKQEVLALLDRVDTQAAQIGAVNTVVIGADGSTTGYNTDRGGFRRHFEAGLGRAAAEGRTAVLIGAGGAGRAVAFALMDLRLGTLVVHDRSDVQTAALLADLGKHFDSARCRAAGDLVSEIAAADGVVNATPVGMLGGIPGNPVPSEPLDAKQWAADVIYTPIETAFIRAAAARGLRTLTGGGMCVHQAAEAFRLFTRLEPDIARMHRIFARALEERDARLAATGT